MTVATPIITTYGALIDSLNHDYADMRHVIVWFADDSILNAVIYPATVVRVLSVMSYHDKEVALEHFRMEHPDTCAIYTRANGWFVLRGYLDLR